MKPTHCQRCGQPPDWRGLVEHHIEPKKMGGRKGAMKEYIERPENKIWLCGKCHSAEHGIKEV